MIESDYTGDYSASSFSSGRIESRWKILTEGIIEMVILATKFDDNPYPKMDSVS